MRSSTSFVMMLLATLLLSTGSIAAQQSKSQQGCINALNAAGAKMAQTQGKEHLACLKDAALGKLDLPAQACLTADGKSKVAKLQDKIAATQVKKCTAAPTVAYTSAAKVISSAQVGRLDAVADIFGPDLDAGVIPCATDKAACKCQLAVGKAAEKLAAAQWKTFNNCKKKILKAGAATAAEVRACISDALTVGSLAADSGGKLQKLIDKMTGAITKHCDAPSVTAAAFAQGDCAAATGATLASCIADRVDCRVCQSLNASDDLGEDCDAFDDGTQNESCGCSPLNETPCDDGDACTLADIECGGGSCAGTAIAPNLFAAITKQLVSVDSMDVARLTVELLTVTRQPFQLTATSLSHPAGFSIESISTEPCTVSAGPSYRCRHTAVLVATSACEGDGSYELGLQYSCSPAVVGCSLCSSMETVPFILDTENFC